MTQKLKLDLFLKELVFFIFAYSLGIFGVLALSKKSSLLQEQFAETSSVTAFSFLIQFFAASFIFFLLLPLFKKRPGLLKLVFYLSIFVGLGILVEAFFNQPFALVITICLLGLSLAYPTLIIHNLVFTSALAGIALALGISFEPFQISLVLSLLSLYDVAAVYLTKHMVKMAQIPSQQGVFLGIIVPIRINDLMTKTKEIRLGADEGFMFLGGGDIVLPLSLITCLGFSNLLDGLVIALFSLFGLFLMHVLFHLKKVRQPMPALPPLVLMTLLGYLFVSLF